MLSSNPPLFLLELNPKPFFISPIAVHVSQLQEMEIPA